MPFVFSFMMVIVSFLWLCYGTAVEDINIQVKLLYNFITVCPVNLFSIWRTCTSTVQCSVPENIHTLTRDGYLICNPFPPGISSLTSYFPFQSLAFETHHPLGICNGHTWCGYEYFWIHTKYFSVIIVSKHLRDLSWSMLHDNSFISCKIWHLHILTYTWSSPSLACSGLSASGDDYPKTPLDHKWDEQQAECRREKERWPLFFLYQTLLVTHPLFQSSLLTESLEQAMGQL